jgi:hypothetical protein
MPRRRTAAARSLKRAIISSVSNASVIAATITAAVTVARPARIVTWTDML